MKTLILTVLLTLAANAAPILVTGTGNYWKQQAEAWIMTVHLQGDDFTLNYEGPNSPPGAISGFARGAFGDITRGSGNARYKDVGSSAFMFDLDTKTGLGYVRFINIYTGLEKGYVEIRGYYTPGPLFQDGLGWYEQSFTVAEVPEPSMFPLLLLCLGVMPAARKWAR